MIQDNRQKDRAASENRQQQPALKQREKPDVSCAPAQRLLYKFLGPHCDLRVAYYIKYIPTRIQREERHRNCPKECAERRRARLAAYGINTVGARHASPAEGRLIATGNARGPHSKKGSKTPGKIDFSGAGRYSSIGGRK